MTAKKIQEALARASSDAIASEVRMREDFISSEREESMACARALRHIEKEWPSLLEKAALLSVGSFPSCGGHNFADHLDFFAKAPRTCELRVNGFSASFRVALANEKLKAKRFRALVVLLPIEEETP